MHKRLFIAVPLSPSFVRAFEAYQMQHPFPWVRWIPAENVHITLYFLGEVDNEKVPDIRARLRKVIAEQSPFSLTFQKLDFGPPPGPPRMIWAYFATSTDYRRLVEAVSFALKPFVYRASRKELIPHVTLARFKTDADPPRIQLCPMVPEEKGLRVSSCDLLESQLTPTGSLYTRVQSFSL